MYSVTEQQVDYILSDIRRRGVEMEDLQLNLLDHVCCIVEQNLKEGEDFEAFYQKTIPKFFKRELWEIEEETITLLTFKNYYSMKKAMIISGSLSVAAFLLGSFFKIMYWPGANVLLFLAMATFILLFLPFVFLVKSREVQRMQEKLLIAVAIFTGMLYATSSLFAVMHWPYRTPLWIATSAVSCFLLIPIYFFTNIKKEGNKVNTIITSIILVAATGILFLMTSLRPSKPVELCNFYSNQDIGATSKFLNEQSEILYKKVASDSTAQVLAALHQKSTELYNRIEKFKLDLINAVDGQPHETVDYKTLFSGNFSGHVRSDNFMFDDNEQPKPVLLDLRRSIDDFTTFTKNNLKIDSFGMLNTSPSSEVDGEDPSIPWERFNFYKVPADMVLRNLTQLQIDIRSVEAVCLK